MVPEPLVTVGTLFPLNIIGGMFLFYITDVLLNLFPGIGFMFIAWSAIGIKLLPSCLNGEVSNLKAGIPIARGNGRLMFAVSCRPVTADWWIADWCLESHTTRGQRICRFMTCAGRTCMPRPHAICPLSFLTEFITRCRAWLDGRTCACAAREMPQRLSSRH